jgi:hypothetical protein
VLFDRSPDTDGYDEALFFRPEAFAAALPVGAGQAVSR